MKLIETNFLLKQDADKMCVLITTGGMNPCHKGHVCMMQLAKDAVEAHGYTCIGGVLSPSHDKYVEPKCKVLKTSFENGDSRNKIADLMINDLDQELKKWLSVGLWETDLHHPNWQDFPVVFREL